MKELYKLNIVGYKPKNVILRTESPIDQFHFDKCTPSDDGVEAVIVSNPLYMIFNQERLSSIGQFNVQEWIDSMNRISNDNLKELRSKVSDDDLIKYMKSRYCQSPCELAMWSSYLVNETDKLSDEVKAFVAQQQTETKSDISNDVVDNNT